MTRWFAVSNRANPEGITILEAPLRCSPHSGADQRFFDQISDSITPRRRHTRQHGIPETTIAGCSRDTAHHIKRLFHRQNRVKADVTSAAGRSSGTGGHRIRRRQTHLRDHADTGRCNRHPRHRQAGEEGSQEEKGKEPGRNKSPAG